MKDDHVYSSGESTSMTLLEQARQGSPEAWLKLVDLYHRLIYYWAALRGLNDAEAADLAQEVLCKVFENIDTFRHNGRKGAFRAWLRTITFRLIASSYRDRPDDLAVGGTTEHERIQTLISPTPDDDDERLSDERSVLYHRLWQMIRSHFNADHCEMFRRVVEKGERPMHVAQDMGVTANTVSVALSRIIKTVKKEFGDLIDP